MITAEEQADYDSFPSPVATTAPLLSIAEQTPTGPQTQPKTATTRAQPGTSTQVKPADPEKQAPAQAQPQAQAQIRPPAPAQPPRPVPPYFPQPQAAHPRGARCVPSESLPVLDEDRLSDFPESEAFNS